ncbi:MAG: type IV secretory system conjugative DNA transfer family protein [bacterium]
MFFSRNKNSHPAAAGRFASYGEIASNFSCSAYDFKNPPDFKSFINYISGQAYYFLAGAALSLILAVIIILPLNGASFAAVRSPFVMFAQYLFLWVILFFIFVFAKNKIFHSPGGFKLLNSDSAAISYKLNKSFELGILEGAAAGKNNKKNPCLLIGLDKKKRFEHALIVSPTGGGKTSRYIIPGIIHDAEYSGVSVFAIDIDSPYLYKSVKNGWINSGKKVVSFDPYEPEGGEEGLNSDAVSGNGAKGAKGARAYFNPLTDKYKEPLSDDKLLDISSMLFYLDKQEIKGGDTHAHKYYSKRSSDMFYGCLLYLKYRYGAKYFDLVTVKTFFERGVKFIEEEINKFNGENGKKIKILFNNFLELPVYERAKIVTDILNNLDFLSDPNVASRFKCKNKDDSNCFFIGDFFAQDMLFIAGIPKEKINSGGGRLMSFITRIFINAIYENRRSELRGASEAGEKFSAAVPLPLWEGAKVSGAVSEGIPAEAEGARCIFMYLDEFPALSLNDFDVELANLRKTNTGVCLTVQDIAFLKDRYGDISLITSNIGTHIVMGHAGYETCRYYSEISGERYIFHKESVRKNINSALPALSPSFGESPVASGLYPLISPDELKNMDRNSVFIYTKYVNPFILNLK